MEVHEESLWKIYRNHKTERKEGLLLCQVLMFYEFAYAISITPCGGRENIKNIEIPRFPAFLISLSIYPKLLLFYLHFHVFLFPSEICNKYSRRRSYFHEFY